MTNDFPVVHATSGSTGVSVAMGFVLGALVGASVAILLAPMSGAETRRRLTDAGRHLGGTARDTMDRARGTVGDLRHDVAAALTS